MLCFSISTIFSSKVNLNCNVFTYSSCRSFINWTHCHQLTLCVSNISFWFNTGKRQATIISSPSSELFRLNFTTKQFSRFGNKKRICPSFVFSCACTCPWKVACHSNELRPYVINNAFLCRGHTGHLHHYACAPSGFLTYPFGVLEYWPWGKMNRLFPFDYKSQTLVF